MGWVVCWNSFSQVPWRQVDSHLGFSTTSISIDHGEGAEVMKNWVEGGLVELFFAGPSSVNSNSI